MSGFKVQTRRRWWIAVCAAVLITTLIASEARSQEGSSDKDKSGLSKRQKEILRGVEKYAPWDCPDRWLYELGSVEERCKAVRAKMLDATSWIHFLAYATILEWSEDEAKKNTDFFTSKLSGVKLGDKVKQNIIFLLALTAADAEKRLNRIFTSTDPKITEPAKIDAGCALAMLGDKKAEEWFIGKFKGSDCLHGKPVFKFEDYIVVEREGDREVTLSYRAWEVLFRRPYFRRLYFLNRTDIYGLQKASRTIGERDALLKTFLPVFPAKWPGHPGCDDFAMYMLNFAVGDRDLVSAYRWAQRTTLLPDQDCLKAMLRVLTAIAESQLSIAQIDEIIKSEDGKHNLDFLKYSKFLAYAKDDKAKALAYFDKLAADDKHGFFAQARRLAAKSGVPDGLRKGVDDALSLKILVDFPSRSKELGRTVWEPKEKSDVDKYMGVLTYREREVALRTRLVRRDSIELDAGKVATQYRTLLELRNLEKLEAAEDDKATGADLRYKQASIVYLNRDVFFPVWAKHHMNFGYSLNQVRYDKDGDKRLAAYVKKTFHLLRAYALFESLRKDYPDYIGADKALFSMAKCYAKVMDYRPAKGVDTWAYPDSPGKSSKEGKLEYGHRRVAELFGRVVSEFPDSNLADDAERAAAYRGKMARILKIKREKKEKADARAKKEK